MVAYIRQGIETIDYGWKHPSSYLVLVPGLSLLIQKIKLAKLLPLPPVPDHLFFRRRGAARTSEENAWKAYSDKSKKLEDLLSWHYKGAMMQIIVWVIAIKTLALPIFSLMLMFSLYEMSSTYVTGLQNQITYYQPTPAGGARYKMGLPMRLF